MENLNEEHVVKLQTIFEIIDQDSDGKITVNDLRETFENLGDLRKDEELITMFAEEGLDINASISVASFLKFMSPKIERMTNIKELKEAFTILGKEDLCKESFLNVLDNNLEVQEIVNEFSKENSMTGEVLFQSEKYLKKQL